MRQPFQPNALCKQNDDSKQHCDTHPLPRYRVGEAGALNFQDALCSEST